MKDDEERLLLRGGLVGLPKQRSKIVSVFVSSTSTDFDAEHDFLLENVYPRLKEFFKRNHGLGFQVVDSRFQARACGKDANLASVFTVQQIDLCRNSAATGPYFITLLSHDVGNASLPVFIRADEFVQLKSVMTDVRFVQGGVHVEDIMAYCYKLDENQEPGMYKLQDLKGIVPGYVVDFTEVDDAQDDRCMQKQMMSIIRNEMISSDSYHFIDVFKTVYGPLNNGIFLKMFSEPLIRDLRLGEVVEDAAKPAKPNGNQLRVKNLFNEIEKRLLELLQSAAKLCLEKGKLNEVDCHKYFQSASENEIQLGMLAPCAEKSRTIAFVKNIESNDSERLRGIKTKISDVSFFEYSVSCENSISNSTHPRYLKKLGDDFYESITKDFVTGKQNKAADELVQEVLHHHLFCNEAVGRCLFPIQQVEAVFSFIRNKEIFSPLLVYGAPGCGLTSMMAKCASLLMGSLQENFTVIIRFLGTSKESSSISEVLKSVVDQLRRVFSLDTVPKDYRNLNSLQMSSILVDQLRYLQKTRPEQVVLMFFDSIHQLDTNELFWISRGYPSNLKLVISTSSTTIIENIKQNICKGVENFVKIEPLSEEIAIELLKKLLEGYKRSLTSKQLQQVLVVFKNAELSPLYVSLIFNIARKWSSFDPITEALVSSLTSIDKSIKHLFQTLEMRHGKLLVSRCLFYLTNEGISDVELEDVLSLDDELLDEITGLTKIRRFPVVLWNRIKEDLGFLVTRKVTNGVQVNCWSHQSFAQMAKKFYVNGLTESSVDQLIINLIDVFCETYRTKAKVYKQVEMFRFTSCEPLVLQSECNMRRINQVLDLVQKIKDPVKRSKVLIEKVFLNYDFLLMTIKKNFLNALLEEQSSLSLFLGKLKYTQDDFVVPVLAIMQWTMLSDAHTLAKFPESLALQLCSRLLPYYGLSEYFTKFIDECDEKSSKNCALLAVSQSQIQTEPALKVVYDFHKKVIACQTSLYSDDDEITTSFYLCENSVCKFQLNKQSFEKSNVVNEFSLQEVSVDEPFQFLQVFQYELNENVLSIGVCVATRKRVFCFNNENGSLLSSITEFAGNTIQDLLLIGNRNLLVCYENCDYFDIYGLLDGKLKERKKYESKVKTVASSVLKKYTWSIQFGEYENYIAVVFEDSTVMIFEIDYDDDGGFTLNQIYCHTFTGHSVCDCLFQSTLLEENDEVSSAFVATLDGMKCLVIALKPSLEIYGVQLEDCKRTANFRVIRLCRNIAFLQDDENLNLFDIKRKKWLTVPGVYRNVEIAFAQDDYLVIYCSDGHSVYSFALKILENKFKIVPFMKPFNFHDQIIDIVFAGEPCVSLQSGLLAVLNKNTGMYSLYLEGSSFDKVSYNVDGIEALDSDRVVSYSNSSSVVDVWSILDGKVTLNIEVPFRKIRKIERFLKFVLVYAEHNEKASILAYNDAQIELNVDVPFCDNFLVHINEKNQEFTVLSLTKESQLTLTTTRYNDKWSTPAIKTISLLRYMPEGASKDLKLRANMVAITFESSLLVLILHSTIILVNQKSDLIVSERSIENSNCDSSYSIEPIENTDDLLVTLDQRTLFYVSLSESNTMNVFSHSFNSCFKETKVKKGKLLSVVFEDEIVIYSLGSSKSTQSFAEPIFKQKFEHLDCYCISDDCAFLATHEKSNGIKLCRLKNGQLIARLPPLASITCMKATDRFLIFGMNGSRRLVSYLIVDPEETSHEIRKTQLKTRNKQKKLQNRDINNCLHSLFQMLVPLADDSFNVHTSSYLECIFTDRKLPDYVPTELNKENSNELFQAIVNYLRNSKLVATPMGHVKVNLVDIGHNLDIETVLSVRKDVKTLNFKNVTTKELSSTVEENSRIQSIACNIA